MLNSKPTIANITNRGIAWRTDKIPPADNIVQANPASILSKQCPDIILAKRRKAKLTTLKL